LKLHPFRKRYPPAIDGFAWIQATN